MTLEVEDVHVSYGKSHVLWGVSLEVQPGQVVALLGRNGAGKTTTCRSIVGLTPCQSGVVRFEGQQLSGLPSFRVARRGVAFVASGRAMFGGLSMKQNLALASSQRSSVGSGWTMSRVLDLFPMLGQLQDRPAGYLSGGERQMMKIARALLSSPKLIVLDEPTEGLAPVVVQALGGWLRILKEEGLSVLLAEQNVGFALRLADYAYVIEKGEVRLSGDAQGLLDSGAAKEYLGV